MGSGKTGKGKDSTRTNVLIRIGGSGLRALKIKYTTSLKGGSTSLSLQFLYPKKETGMRETIQNLNKATLAEATGISYSRLRKFSTGLVASLTPEEREKIYKYLLSIADKFKN